MVEVPAALVRLLVGLEVGQPVARLVVWVFWVGGREGWSTNRGVRLGAGINPTASHHHLLRMQADTWAPLSDTYHGGVDEVLEDVDTAGDDRPVVRLHVHVACCWVVEFVYVSRSDIVMVVIRIEARALHRHAPNNKPNTHAHKHIYFYHISPPPRTEVVDVQRVRERLGGDGRLALHRHGGRLHRAAGQGGLVLLGVWVV